MLGSPPALSYWGWHQVLFSPWIQVGVPAVIGGLVSLLVSGLRQPPSLSWDRDGLTYTWRGRVTKVAWSDYRGYGLSWYIPRRVKLFQKDEEPVLIHLFEFAEGQRNELFTELAVHSATALPN